MVALFVALMFVGFIMIDLVVQKVEAARVLGAAVRKQGGLENWIAVPEGIHLSPGHSWTLPMQEGTVRAGADSLVARALGAASRVALPTVGDRVEAGRPLFRMELNGRSISILSPVSGRIATVNHSLREQPGLVATDPYGKGWVCSIDQSQPAPHAMRLGQKAALWLEHEVARFQEFLTVRLTPEFAVGVTSQDGGLPVPGALAQFDAEAWAAFEAEFLRRH
jgi:glycine cleavage system H protein